MLSIVKAEYLKYRRTFARKLVIIAPLFFVLLALPQSLFMPPEYVHSWNLILTLVYNWWPVLFIPLGLALLASLVENQERRAGNYCALRIHSFSSALLWVGKILVLAGHLLATSLGLMSIAVISGFLTGAGPIPWKQILAGGLVLWFTSLPLVPLQLWISHRFGMIINMLVGFLGLGGGVVAAAQPYWIYVPWSWCTRLMSPIIGVHPNGTFLAEADPLLNPQVIPVGLALAFASFLILTLLTSSFFKAREVR